MGVRGRPAIRERQVERFIRDMVRREGRAPSLGRMCRELGFGTRTEVSRIVRRLEGKGRLPVVGRSRVRRVTVTVDFC